MLHRVHLAELFQDCLLLSVIIKRDVLSVRMSVIRGPTALPAPFNPHLLKSAWPEMAIQGDELTIGYYNLGLQKLTDAGHTYNITLPMVVTSTLLRDVQNLRRANVGFNSQD